MRQQTMIATTTVGHLLQTTWGQGTPYNQLCPEGDQNCAACPGGGHPSNGTVVGCVATAAAQIMKYWRYPSSGTGSHPYSWSGDVSCDGPGTPTNLSATFSDSYDWANMLNSYSGSYNATQAAAVAELCYEFGVACEMDYGRCASGTTHSRAMNAYPTYFGYSNTITREYRDHYADALAGSPGSRPRWTQLRRGQFITAFMGIPLSAMVIWRTGRISSI